MKLLPIIVPAALLVGAGALLFVSYGRHNGYVPPPPPEVGVAHPLQRSVTPHLDATGNTAPTTRSTWWPACRASCRRSTTRTAPGQEAATRCSSSSRSPTRQAAAGAGRAGGGAGAADAGRGRLSTARRRSDAAMSSSQSTLDQARAAARRQRANVPTAAGQANTRSRRSISATPTWSAPFDGVVTHASGLGRRTGRRRPAPTQLATIVQLDPIYVNFNINEQDVLRIRAEHRRSGPDARAISAVPGRGRPADRDTAIRISGTLDYVAPQVDPSTGTLAVRGVFRTPTARCCRAISCASACRWRASSRPRCWCPTRRSAPTRAGAMCWWSTSDDVVEQRTVQHRRAGRRAAGDRQRAEARRPGRRQRTAARDPRPEGRAATADDRARRRAGA